MARRNGSGNSSATTVIGATMLVVLAGVLLIHTKLPDSRSPQRQAPR